MHLPHYDLQTSTDKLHFDFISSGPKGAIHKRIEFTYVEGLSFWNIGFGDYDPVTNRTDDQSVSDNGDSRKVLVTVAVAIQHFLYLRPDATVFFTGSTDLRTRIYGWAITSYWSTISETFHIKAVLDSGDVVSLPTEATPIGFLVTKKV